MFYLQNPKDKKNHASLFLTKSQNPFLHLEKYVIIFYNRPSRTLELALYVLSSKSVFRKEFNNPNNKKGGLKHSMSLWGVLW